MEEKKKNRAAGSVRFALSHNNLRACAAYHFSQFQVHFAFFVLWCHRRCQRLLMAKLELKLMLEQELQLKLKLWL